MVYQMKLRAKNKGYEIYEITKQGSYLGTYERVSNTFGFSGYGFNVESLQELINYIRDTFYPLPTG